MRTKYYWRIPEMTSNLRHLYHHDATSTDITLGAAWYDSAHRIMVEWADTYGYSIATCAAVTAAISPQCEWTCNVIIADDILAGRVPSVGGAYHTSIAKAILLRDTRSGDTRTVFKSGPKVYNFSLNLAGDYSAVTVDTHATQAALLDVESTVLLRQSVYDCFAESYRLAADSLSIEPAVFQAIIWHTWKRLYPRITKIQRRTRWEPMGEY